MIIEYHRPDNISEALALLARETPRTLPMGGGTVLSRTRKPDFAVVDLQGLGLNRFETAGQLLTIGAAATLQQVFESELIPAAVHGALKESLLHETALNLRQTATLGGTLASCDGRSPFVTALLALDPRLIWLLSVSQKPEDSPERISANPANSANSQEEIQPLGDYLPLREELDSRRLMTGVRIPLNVTLRFEMVARSPMDRPVVCAAVTSWPSGRTRVALGGFGKAPILAMDGPEPVGAAVAAREAYRFAEDEWASAAYRMDVAGKLVGRMVGRKSISDQSLSQSVNE